MKHEVNLIETAMHLSAIFTNYDFKMELGDFNERPHLHFSLNDYHHVIVNCAEAVTINTEQLLNYVETEFDQLIKEKEK